MGFYILFMGMRYKAKSEMVKRLDADQYAHEETITLKVPFSIPYNTDDDDYKRVDGEIEHRGEFYRLVKQKLVQDTLFIVCIKDFKTKHIKQALADYVKALTDKPLDGKTQGKTQITFIKDFLPSSFSLSSGSVGWNHSVTGNYSSHSAFDNRAIAIFGPPPKM